MQRPIHHLPVASVQVDVGASLGPLETWRHAFGYGGIHPAPLSSHAISAVSALQPRLVRVFIQEFFQVYRGDGQFDWSRLDPFMDSIAALGAKVVAAICIKPAALYPQIDATVWRPTDVAEWQTVIRALVERYSIDQPLVTHWEIGNEPDIGEGGGCPYLIRSADDYMEYYRFTAAPIREVFPEARIGGPANARLFNPPMPDFAMAWRHGADFPLDFVTYHLYSSLPALHGEQARAAREMFRCPDRPTPELMVTELSPWFEPTAAAEQAFAPHRAGCLAASIINMLDAGLDASFHYHMQDQVLDPEQFKSFFSPVGLRNFVRHFNELPHRFGLLGLDGEPHPQYFLYWMLTQLGDERVRAQYYDRVGVYGLAGRAGDTINVLLANYDQGLCDDRVVSVKFSNLPEGQKQWTVWRIDGERRWSDHPPRLHPLETRPVWTPRDFESQVHMPGGSVALVRLGPPAPQQAGA